MKSPSALGCRPSADVRFSNGGFEFEAEAASLRCRVGALRCRALSQDREREHEIGQAFRLAGGKRMTRMTDDEIAECVSFLIGHHGPAARRHAEQRQLEAREARDVDALDTWKRIGARLDKILPRRYPFAKLHEG